AGVHHITGDLVGDTTFFRSPPSGGSWTVDDLADSEGAEISALTLDELRAQLTAQVEQPRFSGALWGIKIVGLDSGKVIFEHHADRLMSPASNSKLYPGALALDRLGADYHIITPLLATAKPDADGTLHGDLVISGRGDPSWNARHAGTNFWDVFTPFVAALTNAGVHHITGDLVGDTTFFRSPPSGGSWTVDDLADSEGAEISALTLDDGENLFHLFGMLPAGSEPELVEVPVQRPAEWFITALKDALRQNGIVVDGTTRVVAWPSPPVTANEKIGKVVSPPLRELIRDFMKPSQNLETDLIFEHTGEPTRTADTPVWETSEQLALAALDDFLKTNGLPAGDVHFDEGSGLSRNNLTTANATLALLQFMSRHRAAEDYIAALPIAGVDGTLRRRMKNTPAFQNVHAKTGTLRWVNALSGFVTTAAGEKLVFSLMLNRYDAPADRKRTDELDDIAVMLARFDGRTDEPAQHPELGALVVTQFVSAPFPHPARAEGRTRYGQLYSAAGHYSNSTVAMFIPKKFRATDKIDFVVHFHGWNNTVAGTLEQYNLVQQFSESGKNAILIVPEGPYNAPDSFGGKLEDANGFKAFMDEAVEKLRASGAVTKKFQVGNVILSGHSGGYHVMAGIVDRGGMADQIREVWLFDALYGNTENFVSWQKNQSGRLLDIYTDHGGTKEESEKLMTAYKAGSSDFRALEETNSAPRDLAKSRITFIHTDLTHNEVIFRRGEFSQFLKTSCLKNK
ncbi:MAG: D-alanyl-D-alanine carboxypeptidase/D-alanyl-D-alanine-endopeptidase, partial [Verrucomicrobia bacterium]|nr:D-alanyl-D-alanine carboxypeptidase/D-alanyl-D-alanine-endopeptidase [Verrucomicrobiota bacterium]